MLALVMLPPFGNSFFEATIPFSVTKIISQFEYLTNLQMNYKILFTH